MTANQIVVELAERIFRDQLSLQDRQEVLQGRVPQALWRETREAGLFAAAVSEQRGGAGLSWADCCAIARLSGKYAVPAPVVEAILAERMLAAAGLPPLDGTVIVQSPRPAGLVLDTQGGDSRLSGTLSNLAWLGEADWVVAVAADKGEAVVVCIPGPFSGVRAGENLPGEPTGTVALDGMVLPACPAASTPRKIDRQRMHAEGTLLRSCQMVGALQSVLEMTTNYAKDRVQFGRPIGKFQAVQQQLAMMASEVVACECAVAAAEDASEGGQGLFEIAVAKSRLGKAVDMAVDVSHQIHGAIGTTREFPLHHYTMRLAMWRNEYGTPGEWAEWIGEAVCSRSGAALWPYLTADAR